ncbi:MAG: 1,4-alpha-glucan branching protein GlgB [Lachnospiraceae bacterium]|nr:1,4-alpha-glucan branching protein GlgB [Lachnospiraceae bacterium]
MTLEEMVYEAMDWIDIEGIVYSEEDNPHRILGPHVIEEGILIQTYLPHAEQVWVKNVRTGKKEEMFLEDETGFFATIIKGKRIPKYTYVIKNKNGEEYEQYDPYAFDSIIDAVDETRFLSGIHYDIYDKLGAHITEINGVKGTSFAVWAPNAMRVSVVGSFNEWDGRVHQMRRMPESGIFEIFIPGVEAGAMYKYEIKLRGDISFLKVDPYANASQLRPDNACIVADMDSYQWKDDAWIKARAKKNVKEEPMSIYELHLGSWKKKEITEEDPDGFYNYRELAPMVAKYVKKMNYTHIELMPVMEHPLDESWGYQVTGYYAATARYGSPQDLMYFMDYMHKEGIGVIIDWVPAHFPKDTFGLANFDGTCLFENPDPRRGQHPDWGTLIFDFGKPQVDNFLLANALFWADKYHADGIRMDAVASMLYLDYGRKDGEWVSNIYGGNENLEVVQLLRHINEVMNKKHKGVMMIAEESTAWPHVTGEIGEESLGFTYKWNMGWMNDFLDYMRLDPLFRKGNHNALTFSMIYQYTEDFILVMSHDEVTHGKGSMIQKMYGDYDQKFANLRVAYGYMMTHPGKKLLFMGQDFAQFDEWNEKESLQWDLPEQYESHKKLQDFVKALNKMYLDNPALYQKDSDPIGFEWINCMDSERSVVSFMRKNGKDEDTILVVCNFTPVVYEDFQIGVPFKGKYKEILNSDKETFGGSGNTNPRVKPSKAEEWDEREQSIRITVPPLGIAVFQCIPEEKKKTEKKVAAKQETRKTKAKKVSLKAAEEKKNNKEAAVQKEKAAEDKVLKAEETKKITKKKAENTVETEEKADKEPDKAEAVVKNKEEAIVELKKEPAKEEVSVEPEKEPAKEEVSVEPEKEPTKEEAVVEPKKEPEKEQTIATEKKEPKTETDVKQKKAVTQKEKKEETKSEKVTKTGKEDIKVNITEEKKEEPAKEEKVEKVKEKMTETEQAEKKQGRKSKTETKKTTRKTAKKEKSE